MSVKQAQQEIDAEEFAHWRAFYELEPWGQPERDRLWARQAALTWNMWTTGEQRTIREFMHVHGFDPPPAAQSPGDMHEQLHIGNRHR